MAIQVDNLHSNALAAINEQFNQVRRYTVSLAGHLSEEDCCAQSMPDASPVKWHLAHTTWFFETFILERHEAHFQPFHPAFRMLFNSYYNGVGEKHVRAQRGLLTRPSLDEVLAYRHNIDSRINRLFQSLSEHNRAIVLNLVELGLQHEQQHQELILTDVKHLLSMNPLKPAMATGPFQRTGPAIPLAWHDFNSGIVEVGYPGTGFFFDNETPRHREFVEKFSLASKLVTNAEYLAFIEDGGYENPAYWLSEGWDWVVSNRLSHPLYWQPASEGSADWHEFTLYGMQPLDPARPAVHLSYFEADAYARWAGARLPTEAEWEHAVATLAKELGDTASRQFHPHAVSGSNSGFQQLFGACWQWTSSSYSPYPGYAPAPGAIGEYNGKFMVNQYVLRGSSCATPIGHSRLSYRNFFPTTARWQFSGIRLAKS